MDGDRSLQLAEAIDALRQELTRALDRGRDEPIQFELGPVSMTFDVSVTTTKDATGSVQFWVLSAGGSAARASTHSNSITIELNPMTRAGDRARISDRAKRGEG